MVQSEEDKELMRLYSDPSTDTFLLFDDDRPRRDTSGVKLPDNFDALLDELCDRLRAESGTAAIGS